MRRLLIGLAVAAATALAPLWAFAGNQEVADQIASRLKASGQMHGYKIAVKYQEGTAWLKGQVTNREQAETAVRIASQTPGVVRVENSLTTGASDSPQAAVSSRPATTGTSATDRPLRQSLGAFAPDQLSRWMSTSRRSSPVQQVSAENAQPRQAATYSPAATAQEPVGRADRVPAVFTAMPVQPVAVATLQQPAPTRAPVVAQPSAVPPAPPAPAAATQIPTAVAPVAAQPMPMSVVAPQGAPLPIGQPVPMAAYGQVPMGMATPGVRHDQPNMPGYAWPAYAAHPNYAAITYPKQYSPTAWPYIGPFYPYPQVPLGWRKVTMEWHDGWWNLDFEDGARTGPVSGIFRPWR